MLQAFNAAAVHSPPVVVAQYLAPDGVVAHKPAHRSASGLPASVDLHLIGDRRRSKFVLECGSPLKQPAAGLRPQERSIGAGPVETSPGRERGQT